MRYIKCMHLYLYLHPIGYSKENLKIHTGVPSPPFLTLPPLAFPSLSHSPPFLYPLPLEVGARESGECCKLKSILVHFSLKIRHLVATILKILLRINGPPNFIPSPAD